MHLALRGISLSVFGWYNWHMCLKQKWGHNLMILSVDNAKDLIIFVIYFCCFHKILIFSNMSAGTWNICLTFSWFLFFHPSIYLTSLACSSYSSSPRQEIIQGRFCSAGLLPFFNTSCDICPICILHSLIFNNHVNIWSIRVFNMHNLSLVTTESKPFYDLESSICMIHEDNVSH